MKKKILLLLLSICLLCGCDKATYDYVTERTIPDDKPVVTMTFKDYGDIKIELYPEFALNTVANFISMVNNGVYNNNAVTRIQKGFVLQAGGLKEVNYTIKGEFAQNGYTKNTLSHTKGVISMARSTDPNSASTQFFIVLDDSAIGSLDGLYAGFGKVTEGMDIIEKMVNDSNSNDYMGFLEKDQYITIESASVDTKGYNYKLKKTK